jgi:amino acid transporter
MFMKYKYIIYKVYSWTANKKGEIPVTNTILTLSVVHFFHLLILLLLVDRIIVPLHLWNLSKGYFFLGLILYFLLFYFLIYNKRRWSNYIEEFKNEDEKERAQGNIRVKVFLIGSIVLFFILLPILFALGDYLHK